MRKGWPPLKSAGFLLLLCTFAISLNASGQTPARIEVFGGYQYLGYYVYPAYSGPWTSQSFQGFETSADVRILPHLAAEADFSFAKGPTSGFNGEKMRTYMGGPRANFRLGRVNFFGHALFGGLYYEWIFTPTGYPGDTSSATTFATVLGGGADSWFARYIGVRLIQADYIRNRNTTGGYFAYQGSHGNYRISTGLVARF
jgi:hypothetical protein